MKIAALSLAALLGMACGARAQSLLRDDGSPYDPPKKPSLRKHDHVQIQFPAAKADAEKRPRWDKELREWTRFDGKESPGAVTVTAEVADVRPNGVVVLQAVQRRVTNRTEELLRLTGEVASEHVVQGKVSAELLANLCVGYEGPNR